MCLWTAWLRASYFNILLMPHSNESGEGTILLIAPAYTSSNSYMHFILLFLAYSALQNRTWRTSSDLTSNHAPHNSLSCMHTNLFPPTCQVRAHLGTFVLVVSFVWNYFTLIFAFLSCRTCNIYLFSVLIFNNNNEYHLRAYFACSTMLSTYMPYLIETACRVVEDT